MQSPVKINKFRLPVWLGNVLPCKGDPRNICRPTLNIESFEESISAIRIGSTWKSTRTRRHLLTNQLITELASGFQTPLILEIGASSGITSLELLNRLAGAYKKIYVTDLFFMIPYEIQDKATYFYHPLTKHCIMRASDWYIVYEDVRDALFPMGFIARWLLARAPKYDPTCTSSASMLHPDLKRRATTDQLIIIKEYSLFDIWNYDPVDIVKVANVLNTAYFSDDEIRIAVVNLKNAMKPAGKLIITDNRDLEKVSMFTKIETGKFILDKEFNGGAEIAEIVISV